MTQREVALAYLATQDDVEARLTAALMTAVGEKSPNCVQRVAELLLQSSAPAAGPSTLKLSEERAPHLLEKAKPPKENIAEDSLYDSDGIEVETDDESDISDDYTSIYDHHVDYALDSLWENTMPCWRQPRHVFKMSVAA